MNQSYEQDQCFIPIKKDDEIQIRKKKKSEYDISSIIRSQLPSGNDLKINSRPTDMIPRTCFLQLPFYLLPPELNEPCEQLESERIQNKKETIQNKENLPISQYFQQNNLFTLIYDKLKLYKDQGFGRSSEETIRFKNISFLADYNEKQFKDLETEINLNSERNFGDVFDSEFECGNLGRVYAEHGSRKYYLLLENDINTHGYTTWFFFRIKNNYEGNVKFYVSNLLKSTSMYKQGMMISIFSKKKSQLHGIRWFKGGENIHASATNFLKPNRTDEFYSSLYFQYNFEFANDQVYFALNQPYTYSRLIDYTSVKEQEAKEKQILFQFNKPIYTISNNIIPIITLQKGIQPPDKRKVLLFMARQHPAETVGSFVMEGIIDFLFSGEEEAETLLKKYRIIVIPMVNPDGVIHGNSRCNLAGLDLNRKWSENELKQLTPETYHLRKFIYKVQNQSKGIEYLIDVHGHSKKLNSFLFCCKLSDKFRTYYLPLLMSKISNKFDFYSCTYGITKDKISTVRGQLHDSGIKKCYTLENSYYGYTQNSTIKSYSEKSLKEVGKSVVKSLCFLSSNENSDAYRLMCLKFGFNAATLQTQFAKHENTFNKMNKQLSNDKEINSDSDPEGDILNLEERISIYNGAVQPEKVKQINNLSSYARKSNYNSMKEKIKSRKKVEKKEEGSIRRTLQERKKTFEEEETAHRSEKRLQSASNPSRISHLHKQKGREKSLRQQLKKEDIVQNRPVSRQNHELKIFSSEHNKKNMLMKKKVFPTFIYKYPAYMSRQKDKNNCVQNRLRTEILHYMESSKNVNKYLNIKKQEEDEDSLNQTLSIISMTKEKGEAVKESQSFLNEKKKVKTEGVQNSFDEKKMLTNSSFRNEILRRKISLQKRKDETRYRRFEDFKDGHIQVPRKPYNKLQKLENSVFYYFPVL